MYTPDITVDQIIDALGDFLEPFVGSAEIVRGQVNRTPLPPAPCVVLTEILSVDLAVPYVNSGGEDAVDADIIGPTRIDVQIDFYGASAGEQCRATVAAFRTVWGFDQFPANIKPLYMSDGLQAPLTTAEKQYLARWTATASLQYNPAVTVPQEHADEVTSPPPVHADG